MSGRALDAIESLFFLPADEQMYKEARKLLRERFGHMHMACEAFREKIERWPAISNGGRDIQSHADF